MNKINLGKLNVSSLSERELNSVFGGQAPTTTIIVVPPPTVTNSKNGYTQCQTGQDQDAVGDSDVEVIDEHISF